MMPTGLAFKSEGGQKQGELMVVHLCQRCATVAKNRLAGDDGEQIILDTFQNSVKTPPGKEILDRLVAANITLLSALDEREVLTQLFGKPNLPQS
jgi:hypothetical protein